MWNSTSNLYLSLACILGSGLEGIVKQLKLRNSLSTSPVGDTIDVPRSFDDALSCLEDDSFLTNQIIGEDLSQAYLAIRRAEVVQSATKNLSEEVAAALRY
jgi:glutamine synthetase